MCTDLLQLFQAASTMIQYPTQSHYPDTEPAIPCPILLMPSTWLGSDKFQFYKLPVWLSWDSNQFCYQVRCKECPLKWGDMMLSREVCYPASTCRARWRGSWDCSRSRLAHTASVPVCTPSHCQLCGGSRPVENSHWRNKLFFCMCRVSALRQINGG